jgi:hypothetical protein
MTPPHPSRLAGHRDPSGVALPIDPLRSDTVTRMARLLSHLRCIVGRHSPRRREEPAGDHPSTVLTFAGRPGRLASAPVRRPA